MADNEDGSNRRSSARWLFALAFLAVASFVAVVLVILLTPGPRVWTDDAYVEVHTASIAPRIARQIVAIPVDDNQTVSASHLLVQLDDRDQAVSLEEAKATLARDMAQPQDAKANADRQPSVIDQQGAQATALQAQLGLALANRARYRDLAAKGAGTVQSRQSAESEAAQEIAELRGAEASTAAAQHELQVLDAVIGSDRATVSVDEARLRAAQLQLSYTRIVAPVDGVVSARSAQIGDYVNPGQMMMSLVPLRQVYIIANYREVALTHVLPGQHVSIHVDAYNVTPNGIVQGIPPATGAVYSPIPPDNATGNFTKIVQRLPVKILVVPGQRLANLLRAGLSVETTIDTHQADVAQAQQNTDSRVTTN
jgi:membrane fusion protein, multidrug efflux system